MYANKFLYRMNRIENGIQKNNDRSTKTHKNFPIHYGLWEEAYLKRILTYIYIANKFNETNIPQ